MIEIPVEYKQLNAFFADYRRNWSRPWTLIRTDKPFAVGTELQFRLMAPGLDDALVVRGAVESLQADGMRVGFFYGSPEERRATEQRIQELMVQTFGPRFASQLLAPAR